MFEGVGVGVVRGRGGVVRGRGSVCVWVVGGWGYGGGGEVE